jgi:hypothetical protein
MDNSCKYCGSKLGYYTKGYVTGSFVTRFNFDGSESDNTGMYDHLSHKEGKYKYCRSCHKRLEKVND